MHQCGDVVQIDLSYPKCSYCFELKHHKDFRLEDFVTGKETGIVSWWKQTLEECPEGFEPVLVAHRDRGPTLVLSRVVPAKVKIGEVSVVTLDEWLELAPRGER